MKSAEDIVGDLTKTLVVLTPRDTVRDAVKSMVENHTGSALIMENEKIIGIWTERDLMRNLLLPEFDFERQPIRAFMHTCFKLVPHNTSIYMLLEMFAESGLRHFIVEKHGSAIGILETEDVARIALDETTHDFFCLFEHVVCGVYITSKEGRFLEVNKTLLEMTGYTNKEEFLNTVVARDLYANPNERKKFQDIVEREGRVDDYEMDLMRKDRRVIPVLLTAHVRYDRDGNIIGYEGICVDQRKRKRMEEEYQNLFEHVGCGVYITTKEGKFVAANQAMLNILGYESQEEFLKIDIENELYFRPGDRKIFQALVEKNGRVINYEVDFKHRDGRDIPVLLTAHVRYDRYGNVKGYEGICVDRSQMLKFERELKEAHDFMNEIVQGSPNAIIATDLEGRILIWNRAAEKMLGYKAEDVIGKMNIEKIYPDGVARKVLQMVRSEEFGGIGVLRAYPMAYVRQDGKVLEGYVSAALIYDTSGREIAFVGRFVDLEEKLKMERQLRQIQEQLLQSEKLAAMGRLTSQIAHELNNPLYGIMNTLDLLKTEIPAGNKRRKILDMALSETVRLTDMLRKMLSFSKPDEEEKQPIHINGVVDEILLLHEKQLREHSIKLVSSFTQELKMVHASKNQLRQVFLNIIANARDAMPDGGTLTVETRMVNADVHICFTDTGVGIRPGNIGKIFDAFFTTKDVKGVGLGLSVCYNFVKEHGGDIKVDSKYGSGSTFTVILPAIRDEIPDIKRAGGPDSISYVRH